MFSSNYSETCEDKYLPPECNYVNYRRQERLAGFVSVRYKGMVCKNKFDDQMLKTFGKTWDNCPLLQESKIYLTIKSIVFGYLNL